MKIRKVCPEKVEQARNIIQLVADYKGVSVNDLKKSKPTRLPSYTKKLAVFFIRKESTLQRDVVAGLVGLSPKSSLTSSYHTEICNMMDIYDDVKQDVISISKLLTDNNGSLST